MRIVHFSDIHAGIFPRSAAALTDKRLLGALNYLLRRRHACRPQSIARLAARLEQLRPDWVVCSGDLSSIGSPEEFALARDWLRPIRELVGERFLYVPGNHDVYVRDQASNRALAETFHELNSHRCQLADLPLAMTSKDTQLVMIPGAVPVGILRSSGRLSPDESSRLANILSEPRPAGAIRVGIGHFPPCHANGQPLGARRALAGADAILAQLAAGRLDVLLCGHIHTPFAYTLPNRAAILCAGSLTLTGSFAVLDYELGQHWSWQFHHVDTD